MELKEEITSETKIYFELNEIKQHTESHRTWLQQYLEKNSWHSRPILEKSLKSTALASTLKTRKERAE